jgi:tripartite-type tricarboxylate transporter receptor subunit TctC
MNTSRRTLLAWSAALALPLAAVAQDFPNKTVRMIVPFGPGTTTDIVGRVMAESMGKLLGQTVVVENRAGAGGGIGSDAGGQEPGRWLHLAHGHGGHARHQCHFVQAPAL